MKLREETRSFRESLCLQYQQQARGILHLGAHLGQEAANYAKLEKPVLWVEAMPDMHARLVKKLKGFPGQRALRALLGNADGPFARKLKGFPGQRALCALLGDTDGASRTFHVSNHAEGAASSLYRFGPAGSGKASLWPGLRLQMVRELTLPMVTLDRLLRDHGIDPAAHDYWIVDLQGAEILALKGATEALRHCLALYVEVSQSPVYEGGPLWPELRAFLEAAGFMPLWEPELAHDDVLFVRAGQKSRAKEQFHSRHYLEHNQSRLAHLASLGLDLSGKNVLEVGAGIGDHTGFYLDRGCKVTVTEIRPENLAVLQERFGANPAVTVRRLDLDHPDDLGETFDLIHCYGILYHLERPAEALAYLARHCGALLLLETCVTPGDEPRLHPLPEPIHQLSQAFYGTGCRPTRAWVWEKLKAVMPHVYATRTQPDHPQFPLDWRAAAADTSGGLKRAVFVASRAELRDNPNLLTDLPERQTLS